MEDTAAHRIVERLSAAFFSHFRYRPPDSELRAWQNSLEAMSRVMREASLTDHGVLLEYQLPLASRRLDCILAGRDRDGRSSAVVVELKQWERVLPSAIDDCVTVWVGGRDRDVLHPSRQVGQYHQYLEDCHSAFAPGGVTLASCAYLHNLQHDPTEELYHPRHAEALRVYPLFAANQADELTAYLTRRLEQGRGMPVLTTILESKYQPSMTLLAHTAAMIKGRKVFVLLDEQLIVFNTVLAEVANAIDAGTKSVVLVRGGPGTGKSVIALNLVGVLSGRGFATHHATGSRAFTGNIRKVVGRRAEAKFKFFNMRPHQPTWSTPSSLMKPIVFAPSVTTGSPVRPGVPGRPRFASSLTLRECRCSSSMTSRSFDRGRSEAPT